MTPNNQTETATANAGATQNETLQAAWLYSTVQQFNKKYPAFPVGTLRHQIFNEETNDLKKSGAVIRNGRRVLINEPKYFAWLESQNGQGVAA